jgi:hypothetical protein
MNVSGLAEQQNRQVGEFPVTILPEIMAAVS